MDPHDAKIPESEYLDRNNALVSLIYLNRLAGYDVVVTTYAIVGTEVASVKGVVS